MCLNGKCHLNLQLKGIKFATVFAIEKDLIEYKQRKETEFDIDSELANCSEKNAFHVSIVEQRLFKLPTKWGCNYHFTKHFS